LNGSWQTHESIGDSKELHDTGPKPDRVLPADKRSSSANNRSVAKTFLESRCIMENQTERQVVSTRVVRWTARVWSIASVALLLGFVVGEGINPTTRAEALGLLFFPLGICVGMILSWWWEGLGGSITVGSLLVFYVIHLATAHRLPKGWAWLAFAAPGFLFLLTWFLSRKASTTAA
jgi:hypothetical protein